MPPRRTFPQWTAVILLLLLIDTEAQRPDTGFESASFSDMTIDLGSSAVCTDANVASQLRGIAEQCIENAVNARVCSVRPYNVLVLTGECTTPNTLSLPLNKMEYTWVGTPPTLDELNECATLALQRPECLNLFQTSFPTIDNVEETSLPALPPPTDAPVEETAAPTAAPVIAGGIQGTESPVSNDDDSLSTGAIIGLAVGGVATVMILVALLIQRNHRNNSRGSSLDSVAEVKETVVADDDIGAESVVVPVLTSPPKSPAWALADDISGDDRASSDMEEGKNTTMDTADDEAEEEQESLEPPSRVMSHRLGIAPPPVVVPDDEVVVDAPAEPDEPQGGYKTAVASLLACNRPPAPEPFTPSPSGDSKTLLGEALVEDVDTRSLDRILDGAESDIVSDLESEAPNASLLGSFDDRAKWDPLEIPKSFSQESDQQPSVASSVDL